MTHPDVNHQPASPNVAKHTESKKKKATRIVTLYNVTIVFFVFLSIGLWSKLNNTSPEQIALNNAKVKELSEMYDAKVATLELEAQAKVDEAYAMGLANKARSLDDALSVKTRLSKSQEGLCLALLIFTEERQGSELEMATIANVAINRVLDKRKDNTYKWSICSVIAAGTGDQFEGIAGYMNVLEKIVWGEIEDYTPPSAKDISTADGRAWAQSKDVAYKWMHGEYPQITTATHFISFRSLNRITNTLKSFRFVGSTTSHLLMVDHEYRDGKMVVYTLEAPYNQRSYNDYIEKSTKKVEKES